MQLLLFAVPFDKKCILKDMLWHCCYVPSFFTSQQRYHTNAGQATRIAQGYKRSRQVKTMGNGEEELGMTVHASIRPGNKRELLVEC